MSLHDLYGHQSLLNRLGGSIASSRFPQAVLLTGPAGVGKQRIALATAEALFCHDEGEVGDASKTSQQVRRLTHPDLHWFVPLVLQGRSSGPEKKMEETQSALGEVMAERRGNPIYVPPDGRASHSVASARLLLSKVGMTPFQAQRKVVILGDADRLIAQESSQEAANTLLKVLEEPPEDTNFILTSSAPDALLPTIRSRMIPIRVGRIQDRDVETFLIQEVGLPPDKAARLAQGADGSIGRALADAEAADAAHIGAKRFLDAVKEGPTAWAGEALLQEPWGARGAYTAMLDQLSLQLRTRLRAVAAGRELSEGGYLQAIRLVAKHRADAQGNLNPQLGLAVLASEMSEVL